MKPSLRVYLLISSVPTSRISVLRQYRPGYERQGHPTAVAHGSGRLRRIQSVAATVITPSRERWRFAGDQEKPAMRLTTRKIMHKWKT